MRSLCSPPHCLTDSLRQPAKSLRDEREVSTCLPALTPPPQKRLSLMSRLMIIALRYTVLYCLTGFPVCGGLARRINGGFGTSGLKNKEPLSRFQTSSVFQSPTFLLRSPPSLPTLLPPPRPLLRPPTPPPPLTNGSALGAINSSHLAETVISQICSHRLVAAAVASLRHLSEPFGLCSSMYSDSLTGKKEYEAGS